MKKNKEDITINISVTNLAESIWKGDLQKLPAKKIYELVIDYPLSNPAIFKINTGKTGMGLIALLSKIGKLYQQTYDVEDANGRYGIYGHDIDDLAIEGITVDHKKKRITLSVGS